jgi:hypothetical protein
MAGLGNAYGSLLDLVAGIGLGNEVIDHEPLSAPDGEGVIACVFPSDPMGPLAESSGLAAADARLVLTVRLMYDAMVQPQGVMPRGREIELLEAFDRLMDALCADLTLGGDARSIDVLGESGEGLAGQFGYATIDRTTFRIVDVTVPVMINNVWTYGS